MGSRWVDGVGEVGAGCDCQMAMLYSSLAVIRRRRDSLCVYSLYLSTRAMS